MTTVEKLENAKEECRKAEQEYLKAANRMKEVQLEQEVFLSGTHGWDIEYYPCIVKEKNEKELTLKLYEPGIKRYHEKIDVNHIYFEKELNI